MLIGLNLNLTNGILKTNVRTDCCCWAAQDPEGRAGRLIPSSQHSRQIRSLPVSARIRCGLSVLMSRMVQVPGTAPLTYQTDTTHSSITTSQSPPAWSRPMSVWPRGLSPHHSFPPTRRGEERRGFNLNLILIFEDIFFERYNCLFFGSIS